MIWRMAALLSVARNIALTGLEIAQNPGVAPYLSEAFRLVACINRHFCLRESCQYEERYCG
jgi:hypothetical protein